MATIDVLDAAGATVSIEKPLAPGTSAAASSRPVTLSTEDKALLTAIRGAPVYAAATIVGLQTNATGSTFNAFASQACTVLDICNTSPTAVDIEIRRGGSGSTIIVPAGSSRAFVGITNASALQMRRYDQSNTQVTVTAEALS